MLFRSLQCEGSALEPSVELKLVDGDLAGANETPEFLCHSPIFSPTLQPAKSLNQSQRVQGRLPVLLPSPLLTSSTPPNPNNHRAKRRIPEDASSGFTQAKAKRDAYQYPIEDPDEEWTTLPSRKKRKSKFFPISVVLLSCVNIILALRLQGILLSVNRFIYQAYAYHRQ